MAARGGPGHPVALVTGGSFVAEAKTLDAWAARAEPGSRCTYARTARLPVGGVGARARQMAERGMVELEPQRRDPADRTLFLYGARRTEAPFAVALAGARAAPPRPEDEVLLALIEADAATGARCSSNRVLAARLGLKSEAAVVRGIERLRVAGAIRVWFADDGPSRGSWRVAEVVGVGTTAAPPGREG